MKIKNLLPLIGIAIFIIILIRLDFNQIIEIFQKINPVYSFLPFLAFIPLVLIANIQWQVLLKKQKIEVSFWYSLKNFFIGYFYGFITPGGFGAYTKSLYLSDESRAPLPKCLSNIIIFNTVEFTAMLFFGAIGAIILSSIYPYLIFFILIAFTIMLVLYLFFFKKERSKNLFSKLIQSRIFATVKNRLEESIDSFYEDLPQFKDILIPFAISISNWFLKYIILFFIAKLFLIEIPIFYFIVIIAVSDVIASLPISIYGIGTREAALITMFNFYDSGILTEQIISFSLFCYVILWITPSVIGSFVTFYETKKTSEKIILDKNTCKRFEEYMKNYSNLYKNLAKIVKDNIDKNFKNPTIVDLGTGPGLLVKEINKLIPEARVIGIDESKNMLELANKNSNLETIIASSENIPLKDSSVDVIVSRFSLSYWKKPLKSMKQIHRILKPDGKLVIEVLNKDFSNWKLLILKIRWILKTSNLRIVSYFTDAYKTAYTIDNTVKLIEKSDFKIICKQGSSKDWKFVIVAKK
jgi:hypothetical protein